LELGVNHGSSFFVLLKRMQKDFQKILSGQAWLRH
jgi:hypothetical protein